MKSKLGKALVTIFIVLVLAVLVMVVSIVALNRPAPKTPGLDAISIQLPKTAPAVSSKLKAFLRKDRKGKSPKGWGSSLTTLHRKILQKGKWFPNVSDVQKQLDALETKRKSFLEAMLAPGCPPEPGQDIDENKYMYAYLQVMHGAKLLGLRAVLSVQTGTPDPAARELLDVLGAMHKQLNQCDNSLIVAMVWLVAQRDLLQALHYALLHPKLSADLATKVFATFSAVEDVKHNPMPGAFRAEARFQLREIRKALKSNSFGGMTAIRVWPWWDAKQTESWFVGMMKVQIKRASMPISAKFFELSPEEKFARSTPSSLRLLVTYNAIGRILLGVATPNFLKFTLRWHQNRCLAAAHRIGGMQAWKAQQRAISASVSQSMLNPLTQKPFADLQKPICEIWKVPKEKEPILKAHELHLPSAPPITANPSANPTPAPAPTRANPTR